MSERGWRFCIRGMIGFAEKLLAYTTGMDRDAFLQNGLAFDAAVREIEWIGEAARSVPERVRKVFPTVAWRRLAATREADLS